MRLARKLLCAVWRVRRVAREERRKYSQEDSVSSQEDLHRAKAALSKRWLRRNIRTDFDRHRRTRFADGITRLARSGVHAVGIGRKRTEGKLTTEPCVQVFVTQKFPKRLIEAKARIPARIAGIPTDIVETPVFRAAAGLQGAADACPDPRGRQRPLLPGSSAAHPDVLAGTLGWFVRSVQPGDAPDAVFALSCGHVFADPAHSAPGTQLYQPSRGDGAKASDSFATLHRFVALRKGTQKPNMVDAAIGLVRSNLTVDPELCPIGKIGGIASARVGMKVAKVGRTTRFTTGRVDSIGVEAVVPIEHFGPALFVNQIRIVGSAEHPIVALAGDSGALVVETQSRRAVGLLFATASTGGDALLNDIGAVLQALEITLL